MRTVCFDTQIIIWGIEGKAKNSQKSMIPKAEYLIKKCAEEKNRLIIPSVVMAELLCPIPLKSHDKYFGIMGKTFRIIPFDDLAAKYFAEIWQKNKDSRTTARKNGISRAEIKVDYMIVATAAAHGAFCIYSNDPHLNVFSEGYVEVRKLPDVPPEQLSLFEEPEKKTGKREMRNEILFRDYRKA